MRKQWEMCENFEVDDEWQPLGHRGLSRFWDSGTHLTLLHSEWPKGHRVLAILSAIMLRNEFHFPEVYQSVNYIRSYAK